MKGPVGEGKQGGEERRNGGKKIPKTTTRHSEPRKKNGMSLNDGSEGPSSPVSNSSAIT